MLFYDYYSACDCDGNHHGGDERLIDFSANMCFLCRRSWWRDLAPRLRLVGSEILFGFSVRCYVRHLL